MFLDEITCKTYLMVQAEKKLQLELSKSVTIVSLGVKNSAFFKAWQPDWQPKRDSEKKLSSFEINK